MDEDKCCDEECCEEARPTNGPGLLLNSNAGIGLGGNLGRPSELSAEPDGRNPGGNRIDDLVIKQMDLGYLVKVGCQTLCLETKERLIKLFTSYVENPSLTMKRYYSDKLLNDEKTQVTIGVIGYSQEDVNEYLRHASMLPFNIFRMISSRYEGEINGEIYVLIPLTKPEDCKGLRFDRVVETYRARDNKDFGKIIEITNTAIK